MICIVGFKRACFAIFHYKLLFMKVYYHYTRITLLLELYTFSNVDRGWECIVSK